MPTGTVDPLQLGSTSVPHTVHSSDSGLDKHRHRPEPNGVSLVIPAWNEEHRLPSTLEQYVGFLESCGRQFEVIVVADGVTDRTAEIAAGYAQRGVRVLRFDRKQGKGRAVLEGLRKAKFDYVGFLDADAPITSLSVADLLSKLSTSDAAVASRWVGKGGRHRHATLGRRVFSRAWNLLTRVILGLKIHDTQCGAKFFRRDALERVIDRVALTNWAFDASLLFHLTRAGFTVAEVPVDWTDDSLSKMKLEHAIPTMFASLIGIRITSRLRWTRRVDRVARWLQYHFSGDGDHTFETPDRNTAGTSGSAPSNSGRRPWHDSVLEPSPEPK